MKKRKKYDIYFWIGLLFCIVCVLTVICLGIAAVFGIIKLIDITTLPRVFAQFPVKMM